MMLSLYAIGLKAEVLKQLEEKVDKEHKRFSEECSGYQIFDGVGADGKNRHVPTPITDNTSEPLLDLVLLHAKEQLSHLKDDEDCSVSFQLTIQRRNP